MGTPRDPNVHFLRSSDYAEEVDLCIQITRIHVPFMSYLEDESAVRLLAVKYRRSFAVCVLRDYRGFVIPGLESADSGSVGWKMGWVVFFFGT